MASGYFKGSGVNYLCVARRPQWLKVKAGVQGHAYLYGTEYMTHDREDLLSHTNADVLQNHEAVCAVCRSPTASSSVCLLYCFNHIDFISY